METIKKTVYGVVQWKHKQIHFDLEQVDMEFGLISTYFDLELYLTKTSGLIGNEDFILDYTRSISDVSTLGFDKETENEFSTMQFADLFKRVIEDAPDMDYCYILRDRVNLMHSNTLNLCPPTY